MPPEEFKKLVEVLATSRDVASIVGAREQLREDLAACGFDATETAAVIDEATARVAKAAPKTNTKAEKLAELKAAGVLP